MKFTMGFITENWYFFVDNKRSFNVNPENEDDL
jgi:hypothetical protein